MEGVSFHGLSHVDRMAGKAGIAVTRQKRVILVQQFSRGNDAFQIEIGEKRGKAGKVGFTCGEAIWREFLRDDRMTRKAGKLTAQKESR